MYEDTAQAIARLQSLTIRDVMTSQVFTVAAHDSMAHAAKVFLKRSVSAAPVVDETGRLAGFLSAVDFLKREAGDSGEDLESRSRRVVNGDERQPLSIASSTSDLVSDYMTTAVQTVSPHKPLLQAAAMFDAEHLHRLVVVNEHDEIVGIVSTMDIVATLLGVLDEMRSRPHKHGSLGELQ